jgi:hypothetical protein
VRTAGIDPDVNPYNERTTGRVIGWWSGGVASAMACYLALEKWGDDVELVFCDTSLEHPDTYRFMDDFEKRVGAKVIKIKSERYSEPEDVWIAELALNFAQGAPCSTQLKKRVRIKYQDTYRDFAQVFGFDFCSKEINRAKAILYNDPDLNPVFPLIVERYDRDRIFTELKKLDIKPPLTYKYFLNNNCIGAFKSSKGGCVQGGIGYWQKMQDLFPHKFAYMADMEHTLSALKGKPVTVCKDQRKKKGHKPLFLLPCKDFPEIEDISVIKGRQPITPFECNGFCATR